METLAYARVGAAIICVFILLLGPPLAGPVTQTDAEAHLGDNSDWWSSNSGRGSDEHIRTQEREPGDTNFQILGVGLSDNMFSDAAGRLGKATLIERKNDKSSRRAQLCYTSGDPPGKVHLVFEEGAFPFGVGFYLFADGARWTGADLCLSTRLLSVTSSTGSGLRLGQSPSEVIAILGRPSRRRKNELTYAFHTRRKASAEELRRWREADPLPSDEEFHKSHDVYDLEAFVVARFVDSKLIYLAISKAELN